MNKPLWQQLCDELEMQKKSAKTKEKARFYGLLINDIEARGSRERFRIETFRNESPQIQMKITDTETGAVVSGVGRSHFRLKKRLMAELSNT